MMSPKASCSYLKVYVHACNTDWTCLPCEHHTAPGAGALRETRSWFNRTAPLNQTPQSEQGTPTKPEDTQTTRTATGGGGGGGEGLKYSKKRNLNTTTNLTTPNSSL